MALGNEQVAVEIAAKDLASAVIQRVNTNLNTMTTSTRNAGTGAVRMGEGLNKAANAVTNLAGNLLGVNNKIGNMVEGLASFAVGGPLVAGIAAGIAVVTGAMLFLTKQTREAHEAFEKYMDSLRGGKSPLAIVGAELDEARKALAKFDNYRGIALAPAAVAQLRAAEARVAQLEALYAQILTANRDKARAGGAKVAADRAKAAAANTLDPSKFGFDWTARVVGDGGAAPALRPIDALIPVDTPQRITEITNALSPLESALQALGASLGDVKLAFGETFTAAIASANSFADATIGAVGKAIKGTAGVLAREQYAKAAAKFAEGLFPPNPAAIASAFKHILAGSLFAKLAGSGAGGASFGGAGSGGGTSRDFQRRTDALADSQGEVRVVIPRDAVMHAGDPKWQEFMADTFRRLTGRRVTLVPA